ncbi:MAG: CoB--CoM heterodisulfide reductase iron-sulfur subunit B family protein [Chloroflexota bacterium]|nr:CoB--CoM heterodisulfide reductase iron-sulfur subunit B family protein [Chloroflexota bacterium]
MKQYSYFPGCSLQASAVAYDLSTRAVCAALGIELIELEDWNCCGATAYSSIAGLESVCVPCRNLALAEKKGLDLVTPCSACFRTFERVNSHLRLYPFLKTKVDKVLGAAGLEYQGKVRVRHLVDVLLNDVGVEAIASKVVNPLHGLRVAPYYGCQLIRPRVAFDDPENPQCLHRLLESLGTEVTPFPDRSRCCGGSLIISNVDLTLGLIMRILESAHSNGAECIVTVCPLCQMNLDAYQGMVNSRYGTRYKLPVLFLTQLLGSALGIDSKELGFDRGIVSPEKVLAHHL